MSLSTRFIRQNPKLIRIEAFEAWNSMQGPSPGSTGTSGASASSGPRFEAEGVSDPTSRL